MQGIGTAAQVVELHAMQQGIAVAPVEVAAFELIHELQALALVVVTGGKLDGEGVLTVVQLYLAALVEGLLQNDVAIVGHANLYLLFAHKQLCQHDGRQRHLLVLVMMAHPADAEESAKEHLSVLAGQDRAHIELVALQAVADIVVIESETEGAVLVIALHHDAADAIAGGDPDAVALVLGDAADAVVAQAVGLGDLCQVIVHQIQDVQTFTRAYP